MRSLSLFAATVSSAAALSMITASPAAAAPAAPAPVPASGRHCLVHVDTGATTTCFATFTEAIAHATGGRITNAPRRATAAVTDTGFNHRLNALGHAGRRTTGKAADLVLSIEYDNVNFDGDSTVFAAGSGCDDDLNAEHSVPYVGSAWNDRISSFRNYVECQSNHYEHIDFEGSQSGWHDTTENIGTAMNDRTTSIEWR